MTFREVKVSKVGLNGTLQGGIPVKKVGQSVHDHWDDDFHNMTEEEIDEKWRKIFEEEDKKKDV